MYTTPKTKVFKARTTYPENWKELCEEVKKRDGYKCRKCSRHKKEINEAGEQLQVDHIIRLADGGTNLKSNLWSVCSGCHSKRPGHSHMAVDRKHPTKVKKFRPPRRGAVFSRRSKR